MLKEVERFFVSQYSDDVPPEMQERGFGVACTMMILKYDHHYHNPKIVIPTYQELYKELGVDEPSHKEGYPSYYGYGKGAYAEDIQSYFARTNLRYRTRFDDKFPSLQARLERSPIMVGMYSDKPNSRWGNTGHWIVLIQVTDRDVCFLDPEKATYDEANDKISWEEFKEYWDGNAIQIVN